ncbi:methyltransferase [Arthrobacter phage Qui]|jgi:hypothetical protein|uniref:Methyltransferase n=1 Tax=Arthrobacter phage Qui TaxID=2603260 RepID=A0A5B8WFY1_9CAUD|nr:methyltransferase [Arthrobacter phage Qui]QED11614.1 methyltransferase [Arthrobacter phage Qui]QOC56446.1 methyltransferase [Arthrobacter phage Paella]
MTFYTPKPISVEARRFEGGSNAMDILSWLAHYRVKTAHFFSEQENYISSEGVEGQGYIPAQLDLGIPHIKIAEVGDYIVRMIEPYGEKGFYGCPFRVLTEEQFMATYDLACPTCSGQVRNTTNLICLTCGHDYSKGP